MPYPTCEPVLTMVCSHFMLTSLGFTSTTLSSPPRFAPSHQQCNKNISSVQKCSHMISDIKAQQLDYSSSSSSSSSTTQRRSANFQQTIWTNDYLQSLKDDNFMVSFFGLLPDIDILLWSLDSMEVNLLLLILTWNEILYLICIWER